MYFYLCILTFACIILILISLLLVSKVFRLSEELDKEKLNSFRADALCRKTIEYSNCNIELHYQNIINVLKTRNVQLSTEYNELLSQYNLLQKQHDYMKNLYKFSRSNDNSTRSVSVKEFSQEELKRIRYSIHPDKTNGKTHELFLKINNMIT